MKNTILQDTKYDSYTCIAILQNGIMNEKYIYTKDVKGYLSNFVFNNKCDYYISSNTFKIIKPKREKKNIYSLRNIVIDIDCHDPDMNDWDRLQLLSDLNYYATEAPLKPSMTVLTGRGIQVWFSLQETPGGFLWLYNDIVVRLLDYYKNLIQSHTELQGLQVDNCSKNAAGLFRLVGSYNTKSFSKVEILKNNNILYDLTELCNILPLSDEEKQRNKQKQERAKRQTLTEAEISEVKGQAGSNIHLNRNRFLNYLIKKRPQDIGMRDKYLFLYYNNAVQINKNTAKNTVISLNNTFSQALPTEEVEKIFNYVDNHGFLKFRNETFLEWLDCDSKEIAVFMKCFRSQHTHLKQREENKKMNELNKNDRNKQIVALKKQGKTHKEIAETLKIHKNTVCNVLKSNNFVDDRLAKIKDYQDRGFSITEISKQMGISRQSIYNLLKKEQ